MNYNALIENRKSVRAFRKQEISKEKLLEIKEFFDHQCLHLIPEISTELVILDGSVQQELEGTAGYQDFLIGAPYYLVLLSASHAHAAENAGYMMEDMILKLADLDLNSCWLSFKDAEKVKAALELQTDFDIAAIVAFGYGEKTSKKLRLNIQSMSNVDIVAQRHYYDHKKDIYELVSVDQWGKRDGLDELMGFYDDMLWQSFYAAAQSPSYLNRQPYGFVLRDKDLVLLKLPDQYTDAHSAGLNLGIVMLHFGVVAGQWVGNVKWNLSDLDQNMELPEGAEIAAIYHM